MLSYKHRFHGHNSLSFAYKNGRAFRSQYVTIRTTQNKKRNQSRFAVVVSKKVVKSAVGRNRIRRRVFELIRENLQHISPNNDVIVIVTSADLRQIESVELRKSVLASLQSAGVYKSPL